MCFVILKKLNEKAGNDENSLLLNDSFTKQDQVVCHSSVMLVKMYLSS